MTHIRTPRARLAAVAVTAALAVSALAGCGEETGDVADDATSASPTASASTSASASAYTSESASESATPDPGPTTAATVKSVDVDFSDRALVATLHVPDLAESAGHFVMLYDWGMRDITVTVVAELVDGQPEVHGTFSDQQTESSGKIKAEGLDAAYDEAGGTVTITLTDKLSPDPKAYVKVFALGAGESIPARLPADTVEVTASRS